MHRLLVDSALLGQEAVVLPKDAAHHLRVLRPKPSEEVELFDGRGCTRRYHWNPSAGALDAPLPLVCAAARRPNLTLFACVTKGSRWDWTIEKAVELSVARIVPVLSARCVVRLAPGERAAKAARWRRIAEDAARQSDAVWLPDVLEAVDFPEALARVRECGRVFVGALTNPPPPPLLTALARAGRSDDERPMGIFVGPEGDFTPEELAALLEIAVPVSFGPTILRAETAAIFGLSVLAAARHGAV
ncbi:MAG: RsmE family RNA methyltransferase [Kiritimatiellia bacterium]